MKKALFVLCAGLAFSAAAQAAAVDPNAMATEWQSYSSVERLTYAAKATTYCASNNCGAVEIVTCIDEVTRPPLSEAVAQKTIGELAFGCLVVLKAQE